MRFGHLSFARQRVPTQIPGVEATLPNVVPSATRIASPPPSFRLPSRRTRVHPRAAAQSYLALAMVIVIVLLRRHALHSADRSINRLAFRILSSEGSSDGEDHISMHFFVAPKPFIGADRTNQLRALESWLALTPTPTVTLLGDAIGTRHIARVYRLRHESRVDVSFLGVPLLPSVLAATNRSTATVTVLLNADIVLFDDFVFALRKLRAAVPRPWLAIAARWDVDTLPGLAVRGARVRPPDAVLRSAAEHVRTSGSLRTFGGIDLWAWESNMIPLHDRYIPPFAFGRGRYDNWLTHEAIVARTHAVVDISEAITAAHERHDHHLVAGLVDNTSLFPMAASEFWSANARRAFESAVNAYLAARHGSYAPQRGTVLHAPLKLSSCYEELPLCLFERVRPHACRCEHSPYVPYAHNDPYVISGSNVVFCGLLSSNAGEPDVDERTRWTLSGHNQIDDTAPSFGFPLTQRGVVEIVSNRTASDAIILVVADYSDRVLLMETVCSMRVASIFRWLVVVALDDDMYQFCVSHGLAVYLADYDDSSFSDHNNFRQLARLQSILEILQRRVAVFSVDPGSVFASSPWAYVGNDAVDADVGFLPNLTNMTDKTGGYRTGTDAVGASIAAFLARPTGEAFAILKQAMAEMEQSGGRAGEVIRRLACGVNGEGVLRQGECQISNGARAHLFDVDRFRPIGGGACVACPSSEHVILSFLSSAVATFNTDAALAAIRKTGLSRTIAGRDFCLW